MDINDFVLTDSVAVHMVGKYVAVCCNMKSKIKTIIDEGREYDTKICVPDLSSPYIDFIDLRSDYGEWYVDEDSPVEGGLSPEIAEKVAAELLLAVEYMREANHA